MLTSCLTPLFNSVSVLFNFWMNWASNVPWELFITYRYHFTLTPLGFSIFVLMSTSGSIYVFSMWSIFHYHFHFYYNQSYNLIKTDAVFLHVSFFSSQKFSLRVLLSFFLIFCQFQSGVAYKKAYLLIIELRTKF